MSKKKAVMTLQPPKPIVGGKKDERFAGTLKKVDAFIMKLGGHKPRRTITYHKPKQHFGIGRVRTKRIGGRRVITRR